ncbi:MAG: DNA gyrase inhibitor YacG [Gammaproteobacteria bacterium]|nr:DNA gyrase inhibitor YacG [Gammaproteobacteria bacterium]
MLQRHAKCPVCERPAGPGRDNPWRPFCSERCKLLDLGEWLSGTRGIPVTDTASEPDLPAPEGAGMPH